MSARGAGEKGRADLSREAPDEQREVQGLDMPEGSTWPSRASSAVVTKRSCMSNAGVTSTPGACGAVADVGELVHAPGQHDHRVASLGADGARAEPELHGALRKWTLLLLAVHMRAGTYPSGSSVRSISAARRSCRRRCAGTRCADR
jgi:hypothetical protein